MFERSDLRNT